MSDCLRRDRHRQRRRRRHARRATWRPRASGSCCSSAATGCRASRRTGAPQDVFVDNRYISPDTWYDDDGKPFQPQVHYFVGGATKLYGAALYRLREEDFGELRHHDGISPAWPISYDEMEPYYTQAEQLYQVHGARGEDPTEPPASAPYPFPAVSHEPRIQQLSDDLAAAGLPPVPRALRRHARRARTCPTARACAARPATASRASCTPSPTPRCSACARRSSTPNVTLLTNAEAVRARDRTPPGTAVTEVVVERDGAARDATPADIVVVSCGAANTRQAAARLGQRQAPERAGQRLRPGRAQLHVPQQPGRARALQGAEPDRLPEDARAQRLLLRQRRLRVPAGQHPDGRQVAGADVPRREAARDEARAAVDARRGRRARGRLLALDRGPAAAREPRHARRDDGSIDARATRRPTRRRRSGSTTSCKSMLGHLGMHDAPPDPAPRLPRRTTSRSPACAHQAGTCRFGTDPATLGARRRLPGARARQPLRRRHELLPEHRRGEPGADRDGQRAARRRPPARAPRRAAGAARSRPMPPETRQRAAPRRRRRRRLRRRRLRARELAGHDDVARHADRPQQLPPVPAAALPGGDLPARAERHRVLAAQALRTTSRTST